MDPKQAESTLAKLSIFYYNILTPFQCMLVSVIIMMKKHGKDILSQLKKNGIGTENMSRFPIPPCVHVPMNSFEMDSQRPQPVNRPPPIAPRQGFEIFEECASSRVRSCPLRSQNIPTIQNESFQRQDTKMNHNLELEDMEMAKPEDVKNQKHVTFEEPICTAIKLDEFKQEYEDQLYKSSNAKNEGSTVGQSSLSDVKESNVENQINDEHDELKKPKPKKAKQKSKYHIPAKSSRDSDESGSDQLQNQRLANVEIL